MVHFWIEMFSRAVFGLLKYVISLGWNCAINYLCWFTFQDVTISVFSAECIRYISTLKWTEKIFILTKNSHLIGGGFWGTLHIQFASIIIDK